MAASGLRGEEMFGIWSSSIDRFIGIVDGVEARTGEPASAIAWGSRFTALNDSDRRYVPQGVLLIVLGL